MDSEQPETTTRSIRPDRPRLSGQGIAYEIVLRARTSSWSLTPSSLGRGPAYQNVQRSDVQAECSFEQPHRTRGLRLPELWDADRDRAYGSDWTSLAETTLTLPVSRVKAGREDRRAEAFWRTEKNFETVFHGVELSLNKRPYSNHSMARGSVSSGDAAQELGGAACRDPLNITSIGTSSSCPEDGDIVAQR